MNIERVAIVAHGAQNGGVGRVSSILANSLVSKGYKVLYIAFIYNQIDYEIDERIEYVALETKSRNIITKFLERNIKIYRKIKEFAPQIVISFMANVTFLTAMATHVSMIYTPRNDPNKLHDTTVGKIVSNFLYKRAKYIVFQTPGAKDYYSEDIRKKGVIIGNPLDDGLPNWNADGHDKYVITACRLHQQKNIPLLINAFARFHESHTEFILKICGNGPMKEELEKLCANLNISDFVQFLGFRSDVHELMANAEIFALSSDFEGLSNSMLEALAIGVPVVCTDYTPGGAALYINDHVNGILTPVGDEDSFCRALNEIANDVNLQLFFSQNAIKVREELSIETICNQWESLITRE